MIWNTRLPERRPSVLTATTIALFVVTTPTMAQWSGAFGGAAGLDRDGQALTPWSGKLTVSGFFAAAGGQAANGVALWDCATWEALGSGLEDGTAGTEVRAPTTYDGELVAGGDFMTAGGSSIRGIAAWNGSVWENFGSGLVDQTGSLDAVRALAAEGNDLVAGGDFTTMGGVTVNNIARWNGFGWSLLETGTDDFVFALLAHSTGLYVGGAFTTVDGLTANGFARWDGAAWEVFGAGVGGTGIVHALAAHDFGAGLTNGIIGYAKADGDKLPFVFKTGDDSAINTTFIYDREAGTWFWTIDVERGGTNSNFAEVTLTRE